MSNDLRLKAEEIYHKYLMRSPATDGIKAVCVAAMLEFHESQAQANLIDLRNRCAENATLRIETNGKILNGQLAYIAESNEHFEVDKQSILSISIKPI